MDDLYPKDLLRLAADADGSAPLPNPTHRGNEVNPMCGDRVALELVISDGRITAIGQETKACVICQASMSLLARTIPGRTLAEAEAMTASVTGMLRGTAALDEAVKAWDLFSSVAPHRGRHGCVTLPFRALLRAGHSPIEGA